MASPGEVQYVSDADGKPLGVIVPIELWQEIESERETAYLLKSEAMKREYSVKQLTRIEKNDLIKAFTYTKVVPLEECGFDHED